MKAIPATPRSDPQPLLPKTKRCEVVNEISGPGEHVECSTRTLATPETPGATFRQSTDPKCIRILRLWVR